MEKCNDVNNECNNIDEEMTTPLLNSVEEMVEQSIGDLNWMQIWQTSLVSAATFFDSQQSFMSVFTQTMPQWHCTDTASPACHSNKSNLCDLPRTDWGWNSGNGAPTSVISEWGLECATSFVAGLPTTFFFIGCLIGVIVLPTLGDSYLGRKNLLSLCSLIMCLAAFASAFAPNMWVYSILRFISGVGRGPIAVCVLILVTERISKRWRGTACIIAVSALALGPLTLAGVAYLTRNLSWRILYLITSIPGLYFTVIYYFYLYESPRWLFMQGRYNDAIIVLSHLGRSKEQLAFLNNAVYGTQRVLSTNTDPLVALKTLISKKWSVKRLLISIFPTFGIGLVYFGLLLGVENLGYSVYLTTTLDQVLYLLTALLTYLWWIEHCNRRSSLLGFCAIGGVLCMILSIIDKTNEIVVIAMQLVSLFCGCMACNLILLYVVELFPTCVRSSASSVVRLALIMGSVFVPTLNLLGRKSLIYSYGVFGLVMFLSAFLFLCLPETKGKALCDTMEEQEFIDNDGNICD